MGPPNGHPADEPGPSTGSGGRFDPAAVERVLLHGSTDSRRRLAQAVANGDEELAVVLASTVRGRGKTELRARCLEVLGIAVATASAEVKSRVLTALSD